MVNECRRREEIKMKEWTYGDHMRREEIIVMTAQLKAGTQTVMGGVLV